MNNVQIVILAAGAGTRMQSDMPKVLVPVGGKPLIQHLLDTLDKLEISLPPTIVVGHKAEIVKNALGSRYEYVYQSEQKGTAHAILSAKKMLMGRGDAVLTFFGDTPLVSKNTITRLVETERRDHAALTMATTQVKDFSSWRQGLYDFGRIIRDRSGRIVRNVEKKHFTEGVAEIKELNPGFYCFDATWLWENIGNIPSTPPTNEYYLPHAIDLAVAQGENISEIDIDPRECLGVNTKEHLVEIEQLLSEK